MTDANRGRTLKRWLRFYMGGYDFSGYINQLGTAQWEYDAPGLTALDDAVQGGLPNHATIGLGEVKGIFDNTAGNGLHTILAAGAGLGYVVTAAVGVRTAPIELTGLGSEAPGYPVFCGRFNLDQYRESGDDGMLSATLKFGQWDAGNPLGYDQPWGMLLGYRNADDVNTSAGIGNDGLGETNAGGYMVYHVLGSTLQTATISIEDSADNSNFSALSGVTTGEIDCSTKPSGIVALAKDATVREYLRWQIAFGTAVSVFFLLSFVRGR